MIRVSAYYPKTDGGRFDFKQYDKHCKKIKKLLQPLGLVRMELDAGVAALPEGDAAFVVVGHLLFDTQEDMVKALTAVPQELREETGLFTNITPLMQFSTTTTG